MRLRRSHVWKRRRGSPATGHHYASLLGLFGPKQKKQKAFSFVNFQFSSVAWFSSMLREGFIKDSINALREFFSVSRLSDGVHCSLFPGLKVRNLSALSCSDTIFYPNDRWALVCIRSAFSCLGAIDLDSRPSEQSVCILFTCASFGSEKAVFFFLIFSHS